MLRCDDLFCGGKNLLGIAERSEVDIRQGRMLACWHNLASTEQLASRILTDAEPRDSWWKTCCAGAKTSLSLAEVGVSLPVSRWLYQWLELGSPSHDYRGVG